MEHDTVWTSSMFPIKLIYCSRYRLSPTAFTLFQTSLSKRSVRLLPLAPRLVAAYWTTATLPLGPRSSGTRQNVVGIFMVLHSSLDRKSVARYRFHSRWSSEMCLFARFRQSNCYFSSKSPKPTADRQSPSSYYYNWVLYSFYICIHTVIVLSNRYNFSHL